MRKLSYASDGLNAFLGLANAMQDLHPPVYNVAGVPFMIDNKRPDRDHWAECSFSSGLAWFSFQGMDKSDQQDAADGRFPSWSWGNVKLWPVLHDYLDGSKPWYHKPLNKNQKNAQLRDIQIEFISEGNKQVIGLAEYANKSRKAITMSLLQPTALLFKALFVPSHAIGLRSEVENTNQDRTMTLQGYFCHDAHGRSEISGMSFVEEACNETNSGERYPQADLQAPVWVRLLFHDSKFYHDISASGWSLLLLRCFGMSDRSLRVLVIQGLEGNTASRVGTIHAASESSHWAIESMFLRCFSVEREVRLV